MSLKMKKIFLKTKKIPPYFIDLFLFNLRKYELSKKIILRLFMLLSHVSFNIKFFSDSLMSFLVNSPPLKKNLNIFIKNCLRF